MRSARRSSAATKPPSTTVWRRRNRPAGTAMRFLVAALCLAHGRFQIDGTERMRQRPIEDLLNALTQLGARVSSAAGDGCPPVRIDADGLPGGEARIAGTKSSQFVSAL